jgi:hypothetical protein
MRADNKVNDKVKHIPGYKDSHKSSGYLMTMMGIKGVVMPKKMNIHDGETELTAELHMSFFFDDK